VKRAASLVVAGALLAPRAVGAEPPVAWAAFTASPQPSDAATDREAELLGKCGIGEAGLRDVAKRLVAERVRGVTKVDLDALGFALRAAGEPHVWPRAWVVSGRALDRESIAAKLEAWRASFRDLGERRCGVASGTAEDGTEIVAAVALDALADLAPLPTRAHVGAWITVDARVLVAARDPKILVVGPGGDPRPLVSWTRGDHVLARFAPERPGDFTVQVVADVANGPRPLLEARLFADVAPPDRFAPPRAPGEDAAIAGDDAVASLARMLASLREIERLPPLARDSRLDALALAHARRMLAARTVGHDVGDGEPADRALAAGLHPRVVGENVAHAATVRLAHRALYESPSHRANLLRADYARVGLAVVNDETDGSVWVAEIFTSAR
jgi:uncharacterized protein YkwD